jgi:hypothetical protein
MTLHAYYTSEIGVRRESSTVETGASVIWSTASQSAMFG